MAYPYPFVLTTVEGLFGNPTSGTEQWRTTFKIPFVSDAPSGAELETYLESLITPISSYVTNTDVAMGSSTYLVSLAAANIGTDGKYLGGGSQPTTRVPVTPPVAGANAPIHPLTTALCLSMRTSIVRGRASHGRMYWPARSRGVDAVDGLITTSAQTQIIGWAKVLIDQINTAARSTLGEWASVSVMSNLGSGTMAAVTLVSVGRRLDHMESRERNYSEGHVWTPIDTALTHQADADRELADRIQRELADQ